LNRLLTAHTKRILPRYVLCILSPGRTTASEERVQSVIRLTNPLVGDMLRESVEKLSILTDQVYPIVNLDMQFRYGDNPEIADCLTDSKVQNPNQYRACVFTIEIKDNSPTSLRKELGISHLVAVQVVRKGGGWSALGGLSSAKIEVPVELLQYLLHDIALDIAMFHSWPFLVEQFGASPEKGNQFSKMKAEFARQTKRKSFYGPINDESLDYFPLAAYCRRGSGFDYDAYEKLWKEFLQESILGESRNLLDVPQSSDNPIAYIFRHHEYKGQLSPEKISKDVSGLTRGVYLLLLTHKRPKRGIVRTHLAHMFGRKRFRLGLWKIIPFSDFERYAREYPYITFFKFVVSQ
jgi:hypothetical protein